jgi:hypothetical protein
MMPSLVASYNDDDLLATDSTTKDDNFDTSHLFYQTFAKYAALYQQYSALRFGQQTTLYSQKTPGILAIKKAFEGQELIIVFNTDKQAKNLAVVAPLPATKLLYQSMVNQSGSIAPFSFAIYKVK